MHFVYSIQCNWIIYRILLRVGPENLPAIGTRFFIRGTVVAWKDLTCVLNQTCSREMLFVRYKLELEYLPQKQRARANKARESLSSIQELRSPASSKGRSWKSLSCHSTLCTGQKVFSLYISIYKIVVCIYT